MDPTAAAAMAAAALFAMKFVEGAASETGKQLVGTMGKIADRIHRLADGDPEAAAAATLVEADPSDEVRVGQLGKILAKRVATDHELGKDLTTLVAEAEQVGGQIVGGLHVGNVYGGTVVQVGRDQINLQREPED